MNSRWCNYGVNRILLHEPIFQVQDILWTCCAINHNSFLLLIYDEILGFWPSELKRLQDPLSRIIVHYMEFLSCLSEPTGFIYTTVRLRSALIMSKNICVNSIIYHQNVSEKASTDFFGCLFNLQAPQSNQSL